MKKDIQLMLNSYLSNGNDAEDEDLFEDAYEKNEPVGGGGGGGGGGFVKPANEPLFYKLEKVFTSPAEYSTTVKEQIRKDEARRKKVYKEKSSRATNEQVLDPRTRMILYKMLNSGKIDELDGCISTGKEANVYHATDKDGNELAVKVYKTSILVFKDRERYVNGEFRFRRGYCKHNPRKMVKVWAEKEMRNLLRLRAGGIPCPNPIYLRFHVLAMDFIGNKGYPAPRLKDAQLDAEQFEKSYFQCIRMMRRMYHRCKLIHADLSEYNILYYKNRCYFIDVSQSVEHDHPNALNFLRKDCVAITCFFAKKNILTLTARELFDYVTDLGITDATEELYLNDLKGKISARHLSITELVDDKVFLDSFIPRTLAEVLHADSDINKLEHNWEDSEILYKKITGIHTSGQAEAQEEENSGEGEVEDEEDTFGSSEEESSEDGKDRKRGETTEERKNRKKLIKAQQREKRTTKTPKYIKKNRKKQAKIQNTTKKKTK
uniref:Serine/threonine-protein kinase RIO1 n=1 Tax=Arcella intermedia TaxID=1963864 RepID=A0A6B2L2F9_9EUKA